MNEKTDKRKQQLNERDQRFMELVSHSSWCVTDILGKPNAHAQRRWASVRTKSAPVTTIIVAEIRR